MSGDDKDQTSSENSGDEQETSSDTPELSDEGKEKVREMMQAYDDERPTAVLPGTDGTITGVAVNEWLDDDGNPKFGKDEQHEDAGKDNEQQEDAGKDKQHENAD